MPSQSLTRGQPGYNRQRTAELKRQHGISNEPVVTNRPATRGELQRQGVPIPAKLEGPRATKSVSKRSPSARASAASSTPRQSAQPQRTRQSRNSRRRSFDPAAPVSAGTSAGGVGLLEGEFLLAIVLLILLLFSNTEASYTDKIMSAMKRGTLTCLLFFLLALISSIGPNAAKITKAIGALVIVAILVTSPVGTIGTDIDNLIKNDWVGTSEGNQPSADAGTTSGTSSTVGDIEKAIEQVTGNTQKTGAKPLSKAGIEQDVKNALGATAGGIIPGLGEILGKIGL